MKQNCSVNHVLSPDERINRKLERFRIDVANRDYHYLSHSEIDGGKRIGSPNEIQVAASNEEGVGSESADTESTSPLE